MAQGSTYVGLVAGKLSGKPEVGHGGEAMASLEMGGKWTSYVVRKKFVNKVRAILGFKVRVVPDFHLRGDRYEVVTDSRSGWMLTGRER